MDAVERGQSFTVTRDDIDRVVDPGFDDPFRRTSG